MILLVAGAMLVAVLLTAPDEDEAPAMGSVTTQAQAVLAIHNEAPEAICGVALSAEGEAALQLLAPGERIAAGVTRNWQVAAGVYQLDVADCEGDTIISAEPVNLVAGDVAIAIPGPQREAVLTVQNASSSDLCAVEITPYEQENVLPQPLEPDTEFALILPFGPVEQIVFRDCAGNVLAQAERLVIDGDTVFTITDLETAPTTLEDDLVTEAENLAARQQYAAALDIYAQLLAVARSDGDRAAERAYLERMAQLYYAQGQDDLGFEHLVQAALLDLPAADESAVLVARGDAYMMLDQPREALEWYERAATAYRAANDTNRAALAEFEIANAYATLENFEQAAASYRVALEVFREVGNRTAEAAVLYNLGVALWNVGDYAGAEAALIDALTIQAELSDEAGQANVLFYLGATAQARDQNATARNYYEQALTIAREQDNTALIPLLEARIEELIGAADEPTAVADAALALGPDGEASGQVTPDDRRAWVFYGEAGAQAEVEVRVVEGDLIPSISLLAPDGSEVWFDATAPAQAFTLMQTGEYTLIVGGQAGTSGTVAVVVKLLGAVMADPTPTAEGPPTQVAMRDTPTPNAVATQAAATLDANVTAAAATVLPALSATARQATSDAEVAADVGATQTAFASAAHDDTRTPSPTAVAQQPPGGGDPRLQTSLVILNESGKLIGNGTLRVFAPAAVTYPETARVELELRFDNQYITPTPYGPDITIVPVATPTPGPTEPPSARPTLTPRVPVYESPGFDIYQRMGASLICSPASFEGCDTEVFPGQARLIDLSGSVWTWIIRPQEGISGGQDLELDVWTLRSVNGNLVPHVVWTYAFRVETASLVTTGDADDGVDFTLVMLVVVLIGGLGLMGVLAWWFSRRGQAPPLDVTVFLSYRRSTGAGWTRSIHDRLMAQGVRAFMDVDDINEGRFQDIIEEAIRECDYFVPVLAPGTLESDWVRREIALAMRLNKRIIPVAVGGFQLEELPDELKGLGSHNAVVVVHEYFDAAIDRLLRFIVANEV